MAVEMPKLGKLLIIGTMGFGILLMIIVMAQNSSGTSIFLSLIRMLSWIAGILFVAATMRRFPFFENWGLLVKVLFGVALAATIFSLSIMEYYAFNPSEECFISSTTSGCLARMDIITVVCLVVCLWHYMKFGAS